jgi:hypothetical protein
MGNQFISEKDGRVFGGDRAMRSADSLIFPVWRRSS